MPAISIVIPAYNAEKYILETIASVQQQTFTDYEIIVIDDGSIDKTVDILKTVEDTRLNVFSHANAGVSIARNRGIAQARGEFIALLDADDLWTPDKLEMQIKALQSSPQAVLAYSWTYFMDASGKSIYLAQPMWIEGDVYTQLLSSNFIQSIGSNVLIRKKALNEVGGFDSELTHGEDWELCARLAAHWPFVLVPQHQVFYRQHLSSVSSNLQGMDESTLKAIEKIFQTTPPELQFIKIQSLAIFYQFLTQLSLARSVNQMGVKQAEAYLLKAIRFCPRILFKKRTGMLLVNLMILKLFPFTLAETLLRKINKLSAIPNVSKN